MIQLCKGKETAQCTLEQKKYLPLPQNMRDSPCEIKNAKLLDIFEKKNKTLDNK